MIAESPVSDLKAKAEARRAKILAREAARLSAAKGDKQQDGNNETAVTAENEDESSPKGKDRPLAARRNLVKKASPEESTSSEVKESPVAASVAAVDSKDSDGNEVDISASSAAATIKITSARTREIEKEIAINNATFDKSIAAETKSTNTAAVVVKKPVLKTPVTPLQPFQVMRFIRMTAIILLAVATGHRSAVRNMEEVVTFSQSQDVIALGSKQTDALDASQNVLENLNQFLHSPNVRSKLPVAKNVLQEYSKPSISGVPDFYGNRKPTAVITSSRTWVEWVQAKLVAQTESTLTAVAVVWWASTVVSPFVTKALPGSKKGVNIMNMVISFYNNGMEGVFDTVLSRVGELCVHFVILTATPMILTHLALSANTPGAPSVPSGLTQEL